MADPADTCGVYNLRELYDLDARGSSLDEILAGWHLRRLRRGWFAVHDADPRVVEAVLARGVASCLTALAMHGVWVPEHRKKVHMRACGSTMRSAPRGRFCTAVGGPIPERRAVDDLPTSLLHAVKCLDDEGVVAVFDSVLNQRLMTEDDLATLFGKSRRIQRLLVKCDARAQSGIETYARVRLRAMNVKLDIQVYLPCIGGWVDILIGDRLILELDGKEHLTAEQFEKDRARDLAAAAHGYEVVRLSYRQVIDRWAECEAAILAKIRRREHLRKLPGKGR